MSDLIPVFEDKTHDQVNRFLHEALECPQCSAEWNQLKIMSERTAKPRYLIECSLCGYRGRFDRHIAASIRQWNKPPNFFSDFIARFKRKRVNHEV